MRKPGIFSNLTYTDLFLDEGRIRCTTLDNGFYWLGFCLASDDGQGQLTVYDEQHPSVPLMDADKASEYVIRRMIDLIQARA